MKFVASVAVGLYALGCLAQETVMTPERLENAIVTEELERNLYNLNNIAKRNGGNRAFGLPGYKASSDYVTERAITRFWRHFDTKLQYFNHTFEQTKKITVTGPDGESVPVITLLYNHATPVPEGLTGSLIDTPVDDARGSGCFADQWEGIDATGKIALVKRGTCAISDKLKLAKAHGAIGVILWHQAPGTPSSATLAAENIGLLVPVGVVQMSVGEAWKARLAAGEDLVVNLLVDSVFEERETWNVIAETKNGDPNNVIMIGAHLDSVQAGAGINDDGSGTTAMIEIMTKIRYYRNLKNKVRIAFWGAEESGLVGSLFYTANLSEEEADKIRFYFNYDMIGSPFPTYTVYQGENPGDAFGAKALYDYLTAAGKPAEYAPFGTSSDYLGFLEIGVPSSGLFTGAGAPTDPCYHLACDDIKNINWDALTVNAKAAAKVVAEFALSDLTDLPRRSKTSINPRSRTQIRAQLQKAKILAETAEHSHSCAHKGKSTV